MTIRSKAPLRLGLAGGGTDLSYYCDRFAGNVLNATISLYVHCTIETRADGLVEFRSLDGGASYKGSAGPALPLDGEMDLYKAVYNRMARESGCSPLALTLVTYSDVPSGSGLGGSSTLVVAMVAAYTDWLGLAYGEYDIAKAAFEIERLEIGIVGGAQDQYAATFGGVNFMEFYPEARVVVNPLRVTGWILNELEESMVLYFTNITRQASQIEKEKQRLLEDSSAVEAMHEVKQDAVFMKEYLLRGELGLFAEVLGKSWAAKKRVSTAVSNNEIDRVYEVALANGAYSGKVSGAGGGGFMFFLVDPVKKPALVRALGTQGGQVVSFRFEPEGVKVWRTN